MFVSVKKEEVMSKRSFFQHLMLVLTVLICIGMLTVASASANDETTKVQETSTTVNVTTESFEQVTKGANPIGKNNPQKTKVKKKKPQGKFVTKKGNTYYKLKGKKVKNKFIKIKKATYSFEKNGVMTKGWKKYKGDYYYFGRNNGKMATKGKVDGIAITKSGKAKKTSLIVDKINTMIMAKKKVDSICKSTDTKEQKLRKCFDWIAKAPYKRYRFLKPIYKKKGWESTFADDIFKKGDGCCVSESAALAFMLHEAGYKTVYVAHDSEHAWVELNGKVYDALFARAKDYKKYFNLSYSNYNCHAVDKRKI